MNLEDRLHSYFDEHESSLPGSVPALAHVMARGDSRRRRHRLVGLALAATTIVSGAAVIASRVGTTPSTRVGIPSATGGGGSTAVAPFQWSVLDDNSAIGTVASWATTTDGSIYALSTSPGQNNNPTQVLYSSADGRTWSPHAVGTSLHLGLIQAHGADLYALGTAPASVGSDAVAAKSVDHGASWQTITIPVDRGGWPARGVNVMVGAQQMLTTSSGTLVAASTSIDYTDLVKLWPTALTSDEGLVPDATGLTVHRKIMPSAPVEATTSPVATAADAAVRQKMAGVDSVVASKTWAELGVSPGDAAIAIGTPQLFFSADGNTYMKATGEIPSSISIEAVFTLNDAYFVDGRTWSSGAVNPPAQLLRSVDGLSWTSVASTGLSDLQYTSAAGTVHGTAVLIGNTAVFRSSDGVSWSEQRFADLVGAATNEDVWASGAVGPAGVVATVNVSSRTPAAQDQSQPPATRFYVVSSADALEYHSETLASLVGQYAAYVDGLSVDVNSVYLHLQTPIGQGKLNQSILLVGRPS
jgi:hypothetical protein